MFGIDVSHHNVKAGRIPIDWNRVAQQVNPKVDFAYIKATEGQDFQDKELIRNAHNARLAGIKIGYYHFCSLNTFNYSPDAIEEAKDFITAMKAAGPADLPPVLDIEKNVAKLPRNEVLAWVTVFMDYMKRNGYQDVVIYSYSSFLNDNLPLKHGLGNYKLWLAGYVDRKNLKIPNGWQKYWIWQHSQTGKVDGIGTNVDLNTTDAPIY